MRIEELILIPVVKFFVTCLVSEKQMTLAIQLVKPLMNFLGHFATYVTSIYNPEGF